MIIEKVDDGTKFPRCPACDVVLYQESEEFTNHQKATQKMWDECAHDFPTFPEHGDFPAGNPVGVDYGVCRSCGYHLGDYMVPDARLMRCPKCAALYHVENGAMDQEDRIMEETGQSAPTAAVYLKVVTDAQGAEKPVTADQNTQNRPTIEIPHSRPRHVYANTTWELTDEMTLIQRVHGIKSEVSPLLLNGDNVRIGGIAYHVVGRTTTFFIEGAVHVFGSMLKHGFVQERLDWLQVGNLEFEPTEQLWYIVQKGSNIRLTQAGGQAVIFTDFDAACAFASSWKGGTHVPISLSEYEGILLREVAESC